MKKFIKFCGVAVLILQFISCNDVERISDVEAELTPIYSITNISGNGLPVAINVYKEKDLVVEYTSTVLLRSFETNINDQSVPRVPAVLDGTGAEVTPAVPGRIIVDYTTVDITEEEEAGLISTVARKFEIDIEASIDRDEYDRLLPTTGAGLTVTTTTVDKETVTTAPGDIASTNVTGNTTTEIILNTNNTTTTIVTEIGAPSLRTISIISSEVFGIVE
jgi:hypothetical protein